MYVTVGGAIGRGLANEVTGNSLRATLASGSSGIEGDPCVLAFGGGAGIGECALLPTDLDVAVTRECARERAPGRTFH